MATTDRPVATRARKLHPTAHIRSYKNTVKTTQIFFPQDTERDPVVLLPSLRVPSVAVYSKDVVRLGFWCVDKPRRRNTQEGSNLSNSYRGKTKTGETGDSVCLLILPAMQAYS